MGQKEQPVESAKPLNQSKTELVCPKCSYKTRFHHLHQRHVAKHSLDKPFQCPDCGLTDYNHSSFSDHLIDHQQAKILQCCYCQYKSGIFGLRLHMAKHRTVKPYDCSICEFSSYLPGSLKTHLEMMHTKRFSCNYCPMIMTKYVLFKHVKKVHGVDIEKRKGKLLIVETKRGTNSLDTFDDDVVLPENAIPPADFPQFKLPTPRVVLPRLDLDTVDITANGRHDTDPSSIVGNAPIGTEAATPKTLETVPLSAEVPSPEYKTIRHDDEVSSSNQANFIDVDSYQIFISPIPGSSTCELTLDGATEVPLEPRRHSLGANTTTCADTLGTVNLVPLMTSENIVSSESSDFPTQTAVIFDEFPHFGADTVTASAESAHCYSDTFEVLPQPMSPDAVEEPVDIEEEIDVKPDLDTLMRLVSGTKKRKTMYDCNDCDFSTAKKSLLRKHAPKHLVDENFVCTDCEFKETNPYIFAKHLASRRTSIYNVIYCCFCDYSTRQLHNMRCHLERHKSTKLDDCPKCGKAFSSKSKLREHHHVMHTRRFECSDCGKWMTKYAMMKHKSTHAAEKAKSPKAEALKEICDTLIGIHSKPALKCNNCNYATRMKSLLKRHVLKHLLPEADLVCSLCGFTDSSSKDFAAHLKDHCQDGIFDCSFCEYSAINPSHLVGHLEVHRSVHFFDCAKCDKSYAQKSSLNWHKRAYHIDKHRCSECGKIMTLHKLQLHRLTHKSQNDVQPRQYNQSGSYSVVYNHSNSGDVPQALYNCNLCKYNTAVDSLYTIHVAKHGLEEAIFTCPICHYRDQSASNFSVHLQSHSQSSPLVCCFCEFTATKHRVLALHLEEHRSVHFYDCAKCGKSYKSPSSLWTHNRTYHVDEHVCADCGEVITYYELLEHRKEHGQTPNTTQSDDPSLDTPSFSDPALFYCYHCSYTTKYKFLLRRHAVKHLSDARLVCPDCDFKENNAREFAKHCISCQGGFSCSFCTFVSQNIDIHAGLKTLSHHLETHRTVLLYDCSECDHSCSTLNYLKSHFKNMHVVQHKCPQCDEVMSRFELKKHHLEHMPKAEMAKDDDGAPAVLSVRIGEPGRLLCGYCDYSTDLQQLLDEHVAKHENYHGMTCALCEFSCQNSFDFVKHLIKSHQSHEGLYDCCFCGFSTIYRRHLADHIENHKSTHFYDCPKCEASCSSMKNLKRHFERNHVEEHVCPFCNEVVTYHKLKIHEEMHAEQVDPTFCCDVCGYKTKVKRLIRRHVNKHLDPVFVCPECLSREIGACDIARHFKTCLQISKDCCFCSYTSTDKTSLKYHFVKHMEAISFFDCSKCEKSFSSSSELAEHNHLYHKDKHRCSACGKIMTYFKLLLHMKVHQEFSKDSQLTNRYRCNHCTFTTKKKNLLRLHAPKHRVDNRLSCPNCNYITSFTKKFAAHLQIHCVNDEVNCCFCDYATTSIHNLAMHVDQHRPVHFHDCWKCGKSYVGSSGSHSLQKHFQKMHVVKHVCYKDKCYKRMTLYRLQKHQEAKHKAPEKEIPYYVCRGPIKKIEDEKVATCATEAASTVSSNFVEIIEIDDSD